MSAFRSLREFVVGLQSPNDAKANLINAISLMSEINDQYLEIAVQKDEAMQELQAMVMDAQNKHKEIEDKIYQCQVRADENMILAEKSDPKCVAEDED